MAAAAANKEAGPPFRKPVDTTTGISVVNGISLRENETLVS